MPRPSIRRDADATLLGGPFREHIGGFLEFLRSREYSSSTLRFKRCVVAEISRWLTRRQLGLHTFDEERIEAFLLDPRRRYRLCGVRRTGFDLLEYLRATHALPPPHTRPLSSQEAVVADYAGYLCTERGLAAGSVTVYCRMIRPFVAEYFGSGRRPFVKLDPSDVTGFVLRQALTSNVQYTKLRVTVLRSFLRFLHVRGDTAIDLTPAVPTVPHWRLANIPKFIPAHDVHKLLRACDRRTAGGRRDFAVLLLLARLGLRAGEVAQMTLDDVNWEVGELIVRGKGPRLDRIPLPMDVGRALAEYLRRDRPTCASRRLFLCVHSPRRGLESRIVSSIVTRMVGRAGLQTPSGGAHLLRHSLATELLRRGGSLTEIGDLLRHRSPETTTIYAKVDFAALRGVAPRWPEGRT